MPWSPTACHFCCILWAHFITTSLLSLLVCKMEPLIIPTSEGGSENGRDIIIHVCWANNSKPYPDEPQLLVAVDLTG